MPVVLICCVAFLVDSLLTLYCSNKTICDLILTAKSSYKVHVRPFSNVQNIVGKPAIITYAQLSAVI